MAINAAANTAYQYCTGAVDIFVAFNQSTGYVNSPPSPSGAAYLGTCEQYPIASCKNEWRPTFNDIAGPVPFDKQFFGQFKVLVLDLTKFKANVVANLCQFFAQEAKGVRGLYKNLTAAYSGSFSMWLQFSNFGKAWAISDMPAGECYFNCSIPEEEYSKLGTMSRAERLIVEADPAYGIGSGFGANYVRGFNTYSVDPALFAGLPAGF